MNFFSIKTKSSSIVRALSYGIAASFFFAFTFVLNHHIHLTGGYWLWSAALRYFIMLPILYLLLLQSKRRLTVYTKIKQSPGKWLLWSNVGFGLFYAPLCFAAVYAPSWFVAACWQITILCGILLTPLFGKPIPLKNLTYSLFIVLGVFLLLWQPKSSLSSSTGLALAAIFMAAVCYPLGNRKIMALVGNELSTLERVFGMTLCSLPFWIISALIAFFRSGLPPVQQITQSASVAILSGVIATLLFFKATDLVKFEPPKLALIEATQSGEVVFTLLIGLFVFNESRPNLIGIIGLGLIVLGIITQALDSRYEL